MRRLLYFTTILLIVQIGLVVVFHAEKRGFQPFSPNSGFVDFDPQQVTAILLDGKEEGALAVTKEGDAWQVTEPFTVPADSQLVGNLLEKLAGFKRGLAVATSKNAAPRFKVSEDDFRYHINLKTGEKSVADIYFGTSPGFKQLHARTAGSDEIFIVAMASYEISPTIKDWFNKKMLQVDTTVVEKIEFQQFTLEEKDGKWQLSSAEEASTEIEEDGETLLNAVCSITVQDVRNPAADTALPESAETFSFTLVQKDGSRLNYLFSSSDDAGVLLKRSDQNYLFALESAQLDAIKKPVRGMLPGEEPIESGEIEETERKSE